MSHTRRVLHAITPSRMAGAETFLSRLLSRATPGDFEARCVASAGPVLDRLVEAGIDAHPRGIGGKANLLAVSRLHRAAKEFDAQLLHSHLSSASWWCGWLEQFGGPPSVGHVHGFTSLSWHRMQSHLIACSHAVKRDLVERGIPAGQVSVMHCPVDPTDVAATRSPASVRDELGASASTKVVGTFAHLSEKKGYRELVEAAAVVIRELPDCQFWCCGEGPLREELESRSRALGISDRFRLLGFRNDVADLMGAIDVMALPSHREPFGLVYVEAALCECPTIACDRGGAPEIVVPGETGLLVPPRSPDSLASAILEVLGDAALASRMGRHGNERCRELFGWDNYLRDLCELYDRVIDESRSGLNRNAA